MRSPFVNSTSRAVESVVIMLSLGVLYLRAPRRLFAGKERSLHEILRASQGITDGPLYERVLATEHTPSGPFCLLKHGHGLADIVDHAGKFCCSILCDI